MRYPARTTSQAGKRLYALQEYLELPKGRATLAWYAELGQQMGHSPITARCYCDQAKAIGQDILEQLEADPLINKSPTIIVLYRDCDTYDERLLYVHKLQTKHLKYRRAGRPRRKHLEGTTA